MLRFLGRFYAVCQFKSGWIEPCVVGGYAPFSPDRRSAERLNCHWLYQSDPYNDVGRDGRFGDRRQDYSSCLGNRLALGEIYFVIHSRPGSSNTPPDPVPRGAPPTNQVTPPVRSWKPPRPIHGQGGTIHQKKKARGFPRLVWLNALVNDHSATMQDVNDTLDFISISFYYE